METRETDKKHLISKFHNAGIFLNERTLRDTPYNILKQIYENIKTEDIIIIPSKKSNIMKLIEFLESLEDSYWDFDSCRKWCPYAYLFRKIKEQGNRNDFKFYDENKLKKIGLFR